MSPTCWPSTTRTVSDDLKASDAELWELLALDPLVELRLVGLTTSTDRPPVVGALLPEATLVQLVRNAVPNNAALEGAGIGIAEFRRAAETVAASAELTAAAHAMGDAGNAELLDITARALVAQMLAGYLRPETDPPAPFVLGDSARDALLEATRRALAEGSYRGLVPAPVKAALLGLAARVGTGLAVSRRGSWMDPVTSFTADIAFYLRHGQEVRDYLRA